MAIHWNHEGGEEIDGGGVSDSSNPTSFDPSDPKLIRASAVVAAKWWADRLRDGAGVGDNGEKSQAAMSDMLTNLIRQNHPITAKNCEDFEVYLSAAIITAIKTESDLCYRDQGPWYEGGPCLRFGVDYHQDLILRSTMLDAGVHESVVGMAALPWKTKMFCSARRVLIAHGYGARRVEIYGPIWGPTHAESEYDSVYRYNQLDVFFHPWFDNLSGKEKREVRGQSWTTEWVGPVPKMVVV